MSHELEVAAIQAVFRGEGDVSAVVLVRGEPRQFVWFGFEDPDLAHALRELHRVVRDLAMLRLNDAVDWRGP